MSAQQSELRTLSPNDILKNPHNPRILFDPNTLATLEASIKEHGILVPLLVYRRGRDSKYVILDGERRWRCAINLKLARVPVNVISEPKMIEGILRMFNIHNVRDRWELTPTALELEVVMRHIGTKSDKKLHEVTSLSGPDIRRCKALLTYPKKYLDMTLVAEKDERISGQFLAELQPSLEPMLKLPEIRRNYTKTKIVDKMLEKYKRNEIKGIQELRTLNKLVRSTDKGASRRAVADSLMAIMEEPGVGIRESFKATAKIVYDAEKITKNCRALVKSISDLDPGQIDEKSEFVKSIKALRNTIDDFLKSIK
ncbi:MAG TPA: ParB/RepB/Spo0J family partition protein [Candidatus Bathyarchaeia archaeon]|nr:ParB/RepB/Spo0J family partition protein [Candidatus Bathyarchaeia archaeon]